MSFWNTKLTIKNLKVPRFMGGPLDGYTDSPYRQMIRDFSRDTLLYTEMRHVACVAHETGSQKSLQFIQPEHPLNFQVTASSTDFVEKAVERILQRGINSIDLNIACPARAVINSGAGSEMMADLEELEPVIALFRKLIPGTFTVKMRAGFKQKNGYDVARLLEQMGVDAIAIHPRLQTAKFSGALDYDLVNTIKQSVSIPVLFSGEVATFEDAKRVHELTGVDGFLIGRGMLGRPWKFKELACCAEGTTFEISQREIVDCAIKHLGLLVAAYGASGVSCFRKHIPYYIGEFSGAVKVRDRLMKLEGYDEVVAELNQIFE
jgi:nifR3 family TIM-barrel protein